jgi:hypothetical protein
MKFTVEEARVLQTNLQLKPDYFQEFLINEEESYEFKVSLSVLLECLNLFGSNPSRPTGLQMVYMGYGSSLIMVYVIPSEKKIVLISTY